ncbi:MAG: cupin domain-containing protein [Bacteroidota bacterium]
MKVLNMLLFFASMALFLLPLQAQTSLVTVDLSNPSIQAAQIIQDYVQDYRSDRFAADPMTFGISVGEEGNWTVQVTGKKLGDQWEVLLTEGLPKVKTFVYNIEPATLQAIHNGELNALTAQGKAFSGDYTPMSISMMEGYQPSEEAYHKINPFSFHFWTRGFPETIPFSEGLTRKAHGSNFVVFYYEKGLRTVWYRVLPEEKVRHDPREQVMPFPIMVVAIKGTTEGIVDGKRISLEKGNTIFIPPNVHHKWWNETDEASEGILIMFGKGA